MLHHDLGKLDGPILLFGGPYSNLAATKALFSRAKTLGIPASHMICTGDTVAYCAEAAETVHLIRNSGCVVVAGNCERQLAEGAMDCGCGFDAGSTCDRLSAGWFAHADAMTTKEARTWMRSLPDIVTFQHIGRRFCVIHGGLTDISRFIWEVSESSVFVEEIAAITSVVGAVNSVISGHSGIAFQRQVGPVEWINAGVVGMPPNDGAQDTRFAILANGKIRFERLSYNVEAAVQAMRTAGLTQGYDLGLSSGYWPSEDVLPDALRRESRASG